MKRRTLGETMAAGACAAMLVALAWTAPLHAQAGGMGQNMPMGSPVQQSNDDDDDDSRTLPVSGATQVDPSGGATLFRPETISEAQAAPAAANERLDDGAPVVRPPAAPNEFEGFIITLIGRQLPRFGAQLVVPSSRDFALPSTATIPPDYTLNVGDSVSIALTGSVEGSVEREIDKEGRIFLPKVGNVQLAGIRYRDLRETIEAAIGQQYRGYTVAASISRLRGFRVYVTGFANNPGAYSVNSLSTMLNAVLAAGGPSSGGSFRSVKLYRRGAEIADFDLYDFVRRGDRTRDLVLENEDVLFIPPVGSQVAVVGSVNEEAIYEVKAGETVETAIGYAGGPNSLADASRAILYRINQSDRLIGEELDRSQTAATPVMAADIVQIVSQGTLARPVNQQSVLVRIEGEVNRPGNYFVAPATPLSEVVARAGGLTNRAFVYGTRFSRVSVRQQQRQSYREAIDQLELSLAAAPITADQFISAGDRETQRAAAAAALERLRETEPDGRVVLDLSPAAVSLPGDLILENNDTLTIPPRATTVGVFGAVYRPASFLLGDGPPLRVRDYINRAGGPLRAADKGGIFVVRANGQVLPKREGALAARVLPGDVIFVPVKTQNSSLWAKIRDISSIVFQLGLSAATVAAIND